MSEKIELKTFPADRYETLAMAYLNSRDLSDKSPEDIARLYSEALEKIRAEFKNIAEENKKFKQKISY